VKSTESTVCTNACMKKLYLHFQDVTKVVRLPDEGQNSFKTLEECVCSALPHLRQQYTAHMLDARGQQKALDLGSNVYQLEHLDDLFLEVLPQKLDGPPSLPALALQRMLACAASAEQDGNLQLAAELYRKVREVTEPRRKRHFLFFDHYMVTA